MKQLTRISLVGIFAIFACSMLLLAGCSQEPSTYTPSTKTAQVSKPTIANDGVLRVGVNANNAPLAGQSSSSQKVVGIDVDMAAAIADEMGLSLEIVDVSTDASGALTQGTVDMVMGISKSDSTTSFWKSNAYLSSAVALFAQPSNTTTPTNDTSTRIGVQVSSNSAWVTTNEFSNAEAVASSDLKSAFSSLQSGSVNYVAADAVVGTYVAKNASIDTNIVGILQSEGGYCVGVLDGNTQLKQAIATALSTISSNGVSDVIQKKWLGKKMDLSSVKVLGSTASNASSDTQEIAASQDAINSNSTSSSNNSTSSSTNSSTTGTTSSNSTSTSTSSN